MRSVKIHEFTEFPAGQIVQYKLNKKKRYKGVWNVYNVINTQNKILVMVFVERHI